MEEKCILDPQRDCLGLMKAQELERDVNELRKQNSASHERLFDRVGALEKSGAVQQEQYRTIMEKLNDMTEKQAEISRTLRDLEQKPAKRMDDIIKQIIGLVIAAVVGAALAHFGL